MKNKKKKITIVSFLIMLFVFFDVNAQSQLEELANLFENTELGKLTRDPDQPVLKEKEKPETVDAKKLKTLSDLKEERLNQMIMREIEEIENPTIIQRPRNLEIKPRPTHMDEDKGLDFFGYDLFINAPNTFTPIPDLPIPENHILGPGDNIKVILFGVESDEYTLKISREGDALFPNIGPISLGGLTFYEAKKVVSKKVSEYKTGLESFITLGSLRTIQVYVVGDTYQPGSYNLSSLSTLTNALFASGGIRTKGSLRNIQLKRWGETVTNFDFYDFLLKGDNSKDATLRSGDVIFIAPVGKSVGIAGQVRRPAIFELKDDETIEDLLQYAGGLLPTADLSTARVDRILKTPNESGYTLVNIDLTSNVDNERLEDGDILHIYPVVNAMQNVVLLSGYTQKPGFHQWSDNLRITDIIKSPTELLKETDRNYVLIKREDELTGEYIALQMDLDEIFSNKNSFENIVLNKRDEIFFFSKKLDIPIDGDKKDYNKDTNSKMRLDPVKELIVVKNDTVMIIGKEELKIYLDQGYKIAEFLMKPGRKSADDLVINSLEKLVVKDNLVVLIETKDLSFYEALDYEEAVFDKELSEKIEEEVDRATGMRAPYIEPFLTILKQQDTSETPVKIVKITGNVHYPGEYPQSRDMTLKKLIQAAGGLKNSTYVENIELTRKTIRHNKYEVTRSNISGKEKQSLQTQLQAGDAILIKAIEDITKVVEVRGEVFFPGEYSLQEGDTLSSLIERAGGLKGTAFPQGAVFLRESIKQSEEERLEKAANRLQREMILGITDVGLGNSALSAGALAPVLEVLESSNQQDLALGRLVINLDSIIRNENADIILEDGDSITIPKQKQSISVIGEVFVPTSHIFTMSLDIKDYINLSGGETKFADLEGSYIIKANGAIVLSDGSNRNSSFFRNQYSSSAIEPGDTIVVPLRTSQFNSLKAATDITQIIYQMAIAAAAVNSF